MDTTLSLKDWLAQTPLTTEIRYNEDGSIYIPIEFIKPKLDYLSPYWSTANFSHSITEVEAFDKAGNKFGKDIIISGSTELIIEYTIFKKDFSSCNGQIKTSHIIKRVLTGSATFYAQKYYPNVNWGQTCLSLCIVAAAKELGPFFGKDLNKETLTMPTNSKPNKKNDKLLNTIKNINKL